MSYSHIKVETDGPLASLTFNRPQVLNAFNNETMDECRAALHAFADDDGADLKLPHQPAAVPARGERRHHDFIAIRPLPTGLAKRVCFAVHRGVAFLHSPVAAAPEQPSGGIEQRRPDRHAPFGEALPGFLQSGLQQRTFVE